MHNRVLRTLGFCVAVSTALSTLPAFAIDPIPDEPALGGGTQWAVDAMPGRCPNAIELGDPPGGIQSAQAIASKPPVMVAILGTSATPVMMIDPATVRVNGIRPFNWRIMDVATNAYRETPCDCDRRGRDGFPDMVLMFDLVKLMPTLGSPANGDSRMLQVTCMMYNGDYGYGYDCVGFGGVYAIKGHQYATGAALPAEPAIDNYPNPFNAGTVIRYTLPEDGSVSLEVFDVLGRRVATLVDGFQPSGLHEVPWNGADDRQQHVASGMYFYRLTSGETREVRKMVLLR